MAIHRVAVSPKHRGKGVATLLMNYAETLAMQKGKKELRSDTYALNVAMLNCFRKQGFIPIGVTDFAGHDKKERFQVFEKIL